MNVYEKLNEARVKFMGMGIRQTGKNDYAGYTYFELNDILPAVNKICSEVKATCVVSFGNETAVLSFIDAEKTEDKILFTCPMSEAKLKGCHEVQNLGAVMSYIKRYLYQNAFEIAESDSLNKTHNPYEDKPAGTKQQGRRDYKEPPKNEAKPTWTKEQIEEMKSLLDGKIGENPIFSEDDKTKYRKMYSMGMAFDEVKKQITYMQVQALKAAAGEQNYTTEKQAENLDIF